MHSKITPMHEAYQITHLWELFCWTEIKIFNPLLGEKKAANNHHLDVFADKVLLLLNKEIEDNPGINRESFEEEESKDWYILQL